MQEVFEKIINEIRSFVELHRNDDRVEWTGLDWLLKEDDVIKIIKTVAEEYNNISSDEYINRQQAIDAVVQSYSYESDRMTALQELPVVNIPKNNGWIPVEEDKPVLYTKVLITYKTCEGEKVCEGRYNGTYWYDCDTKTKLKAIAWQPLPPKYQPRGETE